jgi:predicted transcriptional regulator YheO
MGKTPAPMSRDKEMEVVERREERGAFLVRRSAGQAAKALDLSRHTIFGYVKEVRSGAGRHHGLPEAAGRGENRRS